MTDKLEIYVRFSIQKNMFLSRSTCNQESIAWTDEWTQLLTIVRLLTNSNEHEKVSANMEPVEETNASKRSKSDHQVW
jgi:hypothetical protein